jgi:hypothetical protein
MIKKVKMIVKFNKLTLGQFFKKNKKELSINNRRIK